ncbi:MAG: thioredoxin [Tenericutes bacterium]|nr:thioredoxin [Mycoplasmatota bacterium]
MVKHITGKEFDNEIKEGIVLVDFYADWCGPCKMLAPILETLASKHPKVKVLKVNVDEEQELAMKYSIMAIPTLMVYKNGKQADVRQGFASLDLLEEMIEE